MSAGASWLKWKAFTHNVWAALRVGCATYVTFRYGFFFSGVYGPSMFPTFGGRGDLVIADAWTANFGTIDTGDVVICIKPEDAKESVIKRVVAVEGESVTLHANKNRPTAQQLKVPPGHVWIEGDNPTMSRDSRDYGPVPLALVRGRVVYQVWPRFKAVGNKRPSPFSQE